MGTTVNGGLIANNVLNGKMPQNGKSYTFSVNCTLGVTVTVDLRALQNQNQFHDAQAIFIDNSANGSNCYMTVGQAGMLSPPWVVPGNSQAILPIALTPGNPVLNFTANGTVNCQLYNFPTDAMVWATTPNEPPTFVLAGAEAFTSGLVVCQLQGSASKVIRIVSVSGGTTNGLVLFQHYSSTATGGTTTSNPILSLDQTNPSPTAVATTWSGTGGNAGSNGATIASLAQTSVASYSSMQFGSSIAQPLTLRSTSEFVTIVQAGNGTVVFSITWTED